MVANATTTITFATSATGASISMELDAGSNLDVDGNTITTFPLYKGEAFILIYCDTGYSVDTNGDKITKVNSSIPVDVIDDITFDMADTKTLSRLPLASVSYDWIGKAPSNPNLTFSGKTIKSPSQTTLGVVRCTYKTLADRWKLNHSESHPVDGVIETATILVVAAIDTDTKASLSVSFEEVEVASGTANWVVSVKDFCSDSELEGTSVWIDGTFIGVTDINGLVTAGVLAQGVHTLQMSKVGYVDSNIDTLNNDTFTIP